MSVGDFAIKYEVGLIVGPLLGLLIGAFGGTSLIGLVRPRRRDLSPTGRDLL